MDDGHHVQGSVLVIDDDADMRSVLSAFLEDLGYRVRAEPPGEAALPALDAFSPDVVITDLKMPGMSGLEVVRRVKERRPETEVVVLTGFATIQDGVEAMREGAYDFLLKPVKIGQIQAILDRCLQWIRHKRSHAELEAVNRKLLELSRMKERFLAVTNHELRTPVTVLYGMLQLLLRQNQDLPAKVRERLEALRQVSGRLVALVRDLHDLAQSRTQGLAVSPDRTTVGKVAAGVRVDFEMARFSRDLELALVNELPEDLPVEADLLRLRQAVTELVQNGVKATPDGGRVEVRIRSEEREGLPRLVLAVRDTGVGIPAEEQSKILEIFHSLGDELHHHTSKYEFKGAGLGIGLAIAVEIAKAHGGGLELESTPGAGSVFTLWIPLR